MTLLAVYIVEVLQLNMQHIKYWEFTHLFTLYVLNCLRAEASAPTHLCFNTFWLSWACTILLIVCFVLTERECTKGYHTNEFYFSAIWLPLNQKKTPSFIHIGLSLVNGRQKCTELLKCLDKTYMYATVTKCTNYCYILLFVMKAGKWLIFPLN